MTYEADPREIVRLFTAWLYAPRSRILQPAIPLWLDPPTTEEASALLPRLRQISAQLAGERCDRLATPPEDLDMAAMKRLWKEWRDDKRLERRARAMCSP
jgi:hypothetical protein